MGVSFLMSAPAVYYNLVALYPWITKVSQCVSRLQLGGFVFPSEHAAADIATFLAACQWPMGVSTKDMYNHVMEIKGHFANTPQKCTHLITLEKWPHTPAELPEENFNSMYGQKVEHGGHAGCLTNAYQRILNLKTQFSK